MPSCETFYRRTSMIELLISNLQVGLSLVSLKSVVIPSKSYLDSVERKTASSRLST